MALYLEYTTIPAEKTVADIQRILGSAGSTAVLIEYEGGQVSAVSFKIQVGGREVPFRLPCRWQALTAKLRQQKKRGRYGPNDKMEEDGRRIAWRQILYWIKSQLALIETGMVDVQEVFLPYLKLSATETMYEHFKANGLKALPPAEREGG